MYLTWLSAVSSVPVVKAFRLRIFYCGTKVKAPGTPPPGTNSATKGAGRRGPTKTNQCPASFWRDKPFPMTSALQRAGSPLPAGLLPGAKNLFPGGLIVSPRFLSFFRLIWCDMAADWQACSRRGTVYCHPRKFTPWFQDIRISLQPQDGWKQVYEA